MVNKLKNNYDKVNPSNYGYNDNSSKGSVIGYEYKVNPPIISTHNERGSGA